MSQLYDSIRGEINQEMISKASELLGEKESNVSNAVSSIVAGLLGVLLKKGHNQQITNILEEAGKINILSDKSGPFKDSPSQDQQRVGDDFLQHLLGDKAVSFSQPIATQTGISEVATNRLVSMTAPIVAGYLGRKLAKDNWSMSQIFVQLGEEKQDFRHKIPTGIINAFGLGALLTAPNMNKNTTPVNKKKNRSWIIWLILILAVLLIFFLWRSCRKTPAERMQDRPQTTITENNNQRRNDNSLNMNTNRDRTDITLTNGTKLQAYKGGIEEKMVDYLQSNDYKNAKDADLKKKWFVFDNVRFEFGSSTQLMDGSQAQLNNIADILKNHKDAKVRIAGFADKKGSEEANMEISKERAKTIENILEKAGVGSQVVRTEGFGDEYATHSASASDKERSEDRDIALRFVK